MALLVESSDGSTRACWTGEAFLRPFLLQVDQPDVGFGREESVIERAVVGGQPIFDDRIG